MRSFGQASIVVAAFHFPPARRCQCSWSSTTCGRGWVIAGGGEVRGGLGGVGGRGGGCPGGRVNEDAA